LGTSRKLGRGKEKGKGEKRKRELLVSVEFGIRSRTEAGAKIGGDRGGRGGRELPSPRGRSGINWCLLLGGEGEIAPIRAKKTGKDRSSSLSTNNQENIGIGLAMKL